MILGVCCPSAHELSKMEDKKLLMLHWRSFLGRGSNIVAGIYAHKCGRYCDYSLMLAHNPVIIEDARPEIGDAPLMLISRMGQRAYRLPF